MGFKVVNSDLFDKSEVEDELHNHPNITVYDKISGDFIIFWEDDYYEDYEDPDLIVVNDENMQIINQLIFNQLKEKSFEEFEDDEFVDFDNILEYPEVDEGDEVDDEDN